ncbi:MAG TPA: oligosaccharide flippase family protein [Candidatus Limnocylindria bacterium]
MVRGAALVTAASGLFVVSGYAVNVWLGRLLGPADYGRFGVVLALITIINVFQNASVPQAVARYTASHPHGAAALLRRGLLLQLGIGAALGIALAAAASLIAAALGDDALTAALRAAAFIVPPYGVYALLVAYHNGRRDYTRQAGSQAAYAIGKAVAVIALAYPLRLIGAIFGYVVAAVIGCVVAAVRPVGGEPSVGIWPLLRLAAPLSVYALASVAQISVDILFVKALGVNDADAGLYAAAQNIARIPYFLMSGMAVLVLPALAGMLRDGRQARAGTARQALRIAVLAAVPISAIVAGSSRGALDLLYGSTYASGSAALSILAVGMAALAVASVAAGALSGTGHPGWSATSAGLGFGVAIIGCAILVSALGPVGGAIATCASTAVTLTLLLARLESSLPGALPWASILRVTAISAAVGVGLAVLDARGLALIGAYLVASLIGVGLLIISGEVGRADLNRLQTGFRRR